MGLGLLYAHQAWRGHAPVPRIFEENGIIYHPAAQQLIGGAGDQGLREPVALAYFFGAS